MTSIQEFKRLFVFWKISSNVPGGYLSCGQVREFAAPKLSLTSGSNWPSAVSQAFVFNCCNGHEEVHNKRLFAGLRSLDDGLTGCSNSSRREMPRIRN